MTDKLDKIREYVKNMSPIFRPAVLLSPELMAENRGYDTAMQRAQRDLLRLLDDPDG